MQIFSFGSGKDTWILIKFHREDWNDWISISAPADLHPEVISEVKQLFVSSGIVDWGEKFVFAALEAPIAKMILDFYLESLQPIISLYPSVLFHMSPEAACHLNTQPPEIVRVRPLEIKRGTPFVTYPWKESKFPEKTSIMVRKSIERQVSGGVYLKEGQGDKLVAGAIFPGFGALSMLYIAPDYRRKGYGSLCIRYIFKELTKEGLHPCLVTDISNKTAVKMYKKIGLLSLGKVTFIANT